MPILGVSAGATTTVPCALKEEYLTGYVYTQEDYDNGVIDDADYVGAQQQIYDKMVQELPPRR